MYAADAQLTASQVLRVFHHDELYLFLGAAFTTVGLVSGALSLLRRRTDALLLWFAVFAILYGNRLWLQSHLLSLMVPPSLFFASLRAGVNYLVPIPAIFFLQAAGLLGHRGRLLVYAFAAYFAALFAAAFIIGPHYTLDVANNVVVIAGFLVLIVRSFRTSALTRDFIIIRRGLLVFIAFALYDNIIGTFRRPPNIEPIGFVFFLAALGYVAARRTLERDQQLTLLQKELDVARRIQLSILPASFPSSPHLRVAARYVPMTSVAGDFYDYLLSGEQEAGLLIADVSGHGVPAALIASMVKLAATSQRPRMADPAALLTGMNAALCGNTQNQFVTAAYVYLDFAAGRLRYAAAGHPPMLLLRRGAVTQIAENGLILAAFSSAAYTAAEHPLEPGDRLLLYTDGMIEAASPSQEQFGSDRLCTLLRDSAHLPAEAAADRIITAVQHWSAAQDDDLTLLLCDVTPAR